MFTRSTKNRTLRFDGGETCQSWYVALLCLCIRAACYQHLAMRAYIFVCCSFASDLSITRFMVVIYCTEIISTYFISNHVGVQILRAMFYASSIITSTGRHTDTWKGELELQLYLVCFGILVNFAKLVIARISFPSKCLEKHAKFTHSYWTDQGLSCQRIPALHVFFLT